MTRALLGLAVTCALAALALGHARAFAEAVVVPLGVWWIGGMR